MATELWAVGLCLLSVAIGAMGPILLKKGADGLSLSVKALLRNKHLFGGLFLYGVATIVYLLSLRGGDLSVLYPLVSLSYPVVSVLSVFLLNERMNGWKWAGIGLIILGVSIIGIG